MSAESLNGESWSPFDRFCAKAQPLALEWSNRVQSYRRIDDFPNGLWHPTGFAVFLLEDVEDFGIVRLHVWPRETRVRVPHHPSIHQHGFRLFSLVLLGEYREFEYDISEDPTGREVTLYDVGESHEAGADVLKWSQDRAFIKAVSGPSVTAAGETHRLDVGRYHSTPIARDSYCATIAVLSRPVLDACDRLAGRSSFAGLNHKRVSVGSDVKQSTLDYMRATGHKRSQ